MAQPPDTNKAPPKPADDSDPAPVVVAGPQAQRREQPEKKDADETPASDKAPVVVTGPEAQARERPAKKD